MVGTTHTSSPGSTTTQLKSQSPQKPAQAATHGQEGVTLHDPDSSGCLNEFPLHLWKIW